MQSSDAQSEHVSPSSSDDTVVARRDDNGNAMLGAPTDIAGYRIVKEIHRGGQGVVYQAVHEGTKRRVAVKVMREGPFASKADQARFEREVQVLGHLNHPGIVSIYDTGVANGSHYFVMDYISGQPLDVYLQMRRMNSREVLELFASICEAVHAAHLQGVIHRDLKPGNIRVDSDGAPHVLDFGLAKSGLPEPGSSAMTVTGQFMGSLPWASPEQAEAQPGRIDVRSDVYSLGVIAYQMLADRFPYDVTGSMREVLENILNAEPQRPSLLRRDINDEVDTIVLKCLQKDRERRYQSAGEIARDVRRFLNGDPIEAKRDSFGYVMSKHIRRHRVTVVVALSFVAVTLGGLFTALYFANQAATERDAAQRAQRYAESKATEADEVRLAAEAEANRARAAEREQQRLRRLADERAEQARVAMMDAEDARREAEAALRRMSDHASSMLAEGRAAEAEGLLRQVVDQQQRLSGEGSPLTQAAIRNLKELYIALGRQEEAVEWSLRENLALQRESWGAAVPLAPHLAALATHLRSRGADAAAEPLLRERVEIFRAAPQLPARDFTIALLELAELELELDKYASAEAHAREALDIAPSDFARLNARLSLGASLVGQERLTEAELMLRATHQRIPPAFRQLRARAAAELCKLYERTGEAGEAQPFCTEAARAADRSTAAPASTTAQQPHQTG